MWIKIKKENAGEKRRRGKDLRGTVDKSNAGEVGFVGEG